MFSIIWHGCLPREMYLARSELKNSTSHINDHDEAKSGQKPGGTIAPYIMIAAVLGIVLVSHFMFVTRL
jgi:hypothetical protein